MKINALKGSILGGIQHPVSGFIKDMGEPSLLAFCTHLCGMAANVHVFTDLHRCDGINRHMGKHFQQVCQFLVIYFAGLDAFNRGYLPDVAFCHDGK